MKGATCGKHGKEIYATNFNPRTHEGCDHYYLVFILISSNFNPRTHEGCDIDAPKRIAEDIIISIHAPMKGATTIIFEEFRSNLNFNPRTHEGCDNGLFSGITQTVEFQSTHP